MDAILVVKINVARFTLDRPFAEPCNPRIREEAGPALSLRRIDWIDDIEGEDDDVYVETVCQILDFYVRVAVASVALFREQETLVFLEII